MKIVLWIGNEANQKALANKIHNKFPLAAIVRETKKSRQKITPGVFFEKVIERFFLTAIGKAWRGMLDHYRKKFPDYPKVPILDVQDINSEEVYEFTTSYAPDLIVVSGTRLIKKKLLGIHPKIGILNLHTGLSPYIKGGPNCTNWCIANKQFHFIGNTIMWIDEGIDSGNLMATEFTSFEGNESLPAIHIKVMEHAHDLYIRSLENIHAGKMNNVPQKDVAKGVTYYTRQWRLKQKISLIKNLPAFRRSLRSKQVEEERKNLRVIPLYSFL